MTLSPVPAAQRAYHHGDLRRTLIQATLALVEEKGVGGFTMAEAARRAGVSVAAPYRHFADREALVTAVSDAALARLATAIDEQIAAIAAGDAENVARAQLRAVGTGYVGFARDNPGLFRAAFSVPTDLSNPGLPQRSGTSGRSPFVLLGDALDEFVASGIMPLHRRPQAEFLAWSAVHGLSMLVIDGPLRALPRAAVDATTQRVIDMVEAGLTAT